MSGWRFGLLLAFVFVALFAATFFLLGPSGAGLFGGSPSFDPAPLGQGEPLPPIWVPGEGDTPETGSRGDEGGPDLPTDEEAGPGALKVLVHDDEEGAVFDPRVTLLPAGGTHIPLEDGGFEIRNLAPGTYRLQVWDEGYVPQSLMAVQVFAGRTTKLTVELEKGIVPRGGVHDEKDRRPIAGALVTLGSLRMRTRENGSFAANHAVPKSTLTDIRVEHPDYDTTTYHQLPGLDPNSLQIPMTRGDARVTLRFRNETRRASPPRYHLELHRLLGGGRRMLKRNRVVTPAETVELKGIHRGRYRLLVSFPDSDLCAQSETFDVEYGERKELTITLDSGADLLGRVRHPRGRVQGRQITLMDSEAFPLAKLTSDRDGRFRIRGVPAGTYQIRGSHGAAPWDTGPFEVPGQGQVRLAVDYLTKRVERLPELSEGR